MRLVFLTVLIFFTLSSIAQKPVPKPDWDSRKEFKAAEPLVLEFIKDLRKNPDKDLPAMKKNDYILRWIISCPYVAVKFKGNYYEKIAKDSTYRYAQFVANGLLFGEVEYFLENPYDRNYINAHRNSVYYTIDMYKKLKIYDRKTKNELLELFVKLEEKGSLNSFIRIEDEQRSLRQ